MQTLDTPPDQREIKAYFTPVDKAFRGFVSAAALFSLIVLIMIAAFLLYRGFEIFSDFGLKFITTSKWEMLDPADPSTATFGIAAMLVGSVITATIAIIIAVPFAMASALFIEYYSPRFLRTALTALLDLVAAIPSVIYGIWGYVVLLPLVEDWSATLNKYLDWIPIFAVRTPIFGRSPFLAGLLLAIMILPIITSVARFTPSITLSLQP